MNPKYYRCDACGENIGWLGKVFFRGLLHGDCVPLVDRPYEQGFVAGVLKMRKRVSESINQMMWRILK